MSNSKARATRAKASPSASSSQDERASAGAAAPTSLGNGGTLPAEAHTSDSAGDGATELLAESAPAAAGIVPPADAGATRDPQHNPEQTQTEPAAGTDKPAAGEDSQGGYGQGEDFSDADFEDEEVVTVAEFTINVPVAELRDRIAADAEAEDRYLVLGNVKVHGKLRERGDVIHLTPSLAASIVAADNALAVPEEIELGEIVRLTENEIAVLLAIIAGMPEDD